MAAQMGLAAAGAQQRDVTVARDLPLVARGGDAATPAPPRGAAPRGPVSYDALGRAGRWHTRLVFDAASCEGWLDARRVVGCDVDKEWTRDPALAGWVRGTFGPDHLREGGAEIVLANVSHVGQCRYLAHFHLTQPGEYYLWGDVMHAGYDALNELREK
eukprot:gene38547-55140_t